VSCFLEVLQAGRQAGALASAPGSAGSLHVSTAIVVWRKCDEMSI
jgi:hypothetical protein